MSLLDTRLLAFRAQSPLDKWEHRASQYGFLDLFAAQSRGSNSIITQDMVTKAIAAAGSVLEVPVIDYRADTVQNTTLPLVIAGTPSTSRMVAISFTDYYFGFLIHPAQHFNNEISMQREFNRQYERHVLELLQQLDVNSGAALEARKTQVQPGDLLGGRYGFVANNVVAPPSEHKAAMGDSGVLQKENDYYGMMHVVGNPSLESFMNNNVREFGQFNTQDKAYQLRDKMFHFTNNLANGVGNQGAMFVVPSGSVGHLQQFAPDCVMRNRTRDGKYIWDIEANMPILGMPMGTYSYDGAVDGSTLSGAATALNTATLSQAFGFHMRLANVIVYNSDPATRPDPIMKMVMSNTELA